MTGYNETSNQRAFVDPYDVEYGDGYRAGVEAVIAHLKTLHPQNVTSRYILELRSAIQQGLI